MDVNQLHIDIERSGQGALWKHSKARASHHFHLYRTVVIQFAFIHQLPSAILKISIRQLSAIRHLCLARDAERQNAVALGIPVAGVGIVHVLRGALASIASIMKGCVNGLVSASILALRAFYNGNRRKEVDHLLLHPPSLVMSRLLTDYKDIVSTSGLTLPDLPLLPPWGR